MSESKTDSPPQPAPPAKAYSAFVPLVLIAVAMLIVMWYNYRSLADQGALLQRQLGQQEAAVAQSEQASQKAQRLLSDLLSMAQSDPQAAAIVRKHRIERRNPNPGPAEPAPTE